MWLWQHKNIHKRHLFWAKLFGVCFFFHCICLFLIFCVYRDNAYIFSISLHKKIDLSVPIVFKLYNTSTPRTAQNAPIKTAPLPKLAENKQKITTIVQSSPPVKTAQNNTINKQKSTQPRVAPTPVPKNEQLKTSSAEQPTPPSIKKENIQSVAAPAVAKALDIHQTITPTIAQNAHICDNYKEVDILRKHAQLHDEITKQWKPPIGVPLTCTCDVSFSVSKQGKIQNLTIQRSSGILMYDISARQALYSMTMPRWTYGKQLIINFKQ